MSKKIEHESKPDDKADTTPKHDDSETKKSKLHGANRLIAYYGSRKKWTIPLTIVVVVAILFAIPFSRYDVLGLFLTKNESITVIDSTTNTPVTDAQIQYGTQLATSSSHGMVIMNLPVGNDGLSISKEFYQTVNEKVLVSLSASHNKLQVKLVAIGRQVPVTVINKITQAPIENAEVKVLNTEAKTDKNGKAIIVLPAKQSMLNASVTAMNYNDETAKVTVTSQAVPSNTFSITPSGKFYFLSNLSGTIDVVKTNLDGSDRQTILPGTGYESTRDTVLLASRDWKYLVLYAQRSKNGSPELDLINASTGKLTNIDTENSNVYFQLVGWDGDDFIYQVVRNNLQNQNGFEAIKSYAAQTNTLKTIYQTADNGGEGTTIGGVYIINGKVVYATGYNGYGFILQPLGKIPSLNEVNSDGTDNQVVKNFAPPPGQAPGYTIELVPYDEPNSLAITYYYGSYSSSVEYYEYENSKVSLSTDLTSQSFDNNVYPTFLLSPSGNQTFWSEPADGKNNLFVGDANGNHKKQIETLSDYSPYGWFTDQYLLVSKNSSELYIMPVNGGNPIPVTDYFKPSQFYNNGYGGGYGGL